MTARRNLAKSPSRRRLRALSRMGLSIFSGVRLPPFGKGGLGGIFELGSFGKSPSIPLCQRGRIYTRRRTLPTLFAMHHRLNSWKLHGVGVSTEAIPAAQRGNVSTFMPNSSSYTLDYETGFILVAATKDVAGHIAMFGPGVNRNMGSGEEKITGDTVGSETVEMAVENLDVGTFQGRIKDCFPEVLGIYLVRAAAEELDQMMDAVRALLGSGWVVIL